MEWSDDAIVLSVRPHGETSAILEVLTHHHGRHLGLVRGGASRRSRPSLLPGNTLHVNWRARLNEHLGNFAVEHFTGPRLHEFDCKIAKVFVETRAPADTHGIARQERRP